MSHLLQMRGLKLDITNFVKNVCHVASFTDAWIETKPDNFIALSVVVASFTDAWIETIQTKMKAYLSLSHLLQMRGLKLINPEARKKALDVASFTDAWIETLPNSGAFSKERSRIFYRCVD